VGSQLRTYSPKQVRQRFQYDQADLRGVNTAIFFRGVAEKKIAHLGYEFNARVPAAHNDEGKQGLTRSGVNRVISVLAKVNNVFAQLHSLLQRFVVPTIFASAGSVEKFRPRSRPKNKRVVFYRSGVDDQAPAYGVHGTNCFPAKYKFAFAANFANSLNDVSRIGKAGRDLRKQRSEEQVILFAKQENFYVRIAAEQAVELCNSFQTAEPRADDCDALHATYKSSTVTRAIKLGRFGMEKLILRGQNAAHPEKRAASTGAKPVS
jgi:hypothetical protein